MKTLAFAAIAAFVVVGSGATVGALSSPISPLPTPAATATATPTATPTPTPTPRVLFFPVWANEGRY